MSGAPYSGVAVRRSAVHFLTGKAASGALAVLILLWVVRLLSITEYAAYVALAATLELVLALAALGLPWLAARYLPEFRLNAKGTRLARLVFRLLTVQGLLLAVFTGILAALLDIGLAWLGLSAFRDAALLYLVLLFVDGIGRATRECVLEPLLQQGAVQSSLVLRNAAFLFFLGVAVGAGNVDLVGVVFAELLASLVGTSATIYLLARYLPSIRGLAGSAGWREPALFAMWPVAGQMYLSHLLTLTYSPQFYLLIVSRYLGHEAAAIFGFLRNLYGQVCRYLPAMLLFNVIRPKLVAVYVSQGDARELARTANLVGKMSLFVLMPLAALTAVAGDELIALLSGGKFAQAGVYFLGFMVALIPFSQRQVLEAVAVSSGHGDLCARASALGMLTLPLTYGLLLAGVGLWAPIVALGAGYLMFNSVIVLGMRQRLGYKADYIGLLKLCAAAAIACLGTFWLSDSRSPAVHLATSTLFVTIVFLGVAWLIKPFTKAERARINGFVGRQIFVW